MDEAQLFECVPNFSEGRDQEVIDAIARGAAAAHVLDVDPDPDHHRVVVTLAGARARILEALPGAIAAAAEGIDLRIHGGVHPRVGAADVVPIVPLGTTSLEACHQLAREVGERIWTHLHIPVFFYGHGERWTLADIRAGRARPSLGGPGLHPTAGAVCVGARRLLVAFNVLLPGMSLSDARALARSLRETASGMRGVQALVFELPDGRLQLSMNLFRVDETSPADVVDELARRSVTIGEQQLVGLCPAAAANDAADERLLEGRLGAAAAREGAVRCREKGGEESTALAAKLESEAAGLAALGVSQEALLAGAERCAALRPVLKAAGVINDELGAMAMVAARGLRAAVHTDTAAAYNARLTALDRWIVASA